MAIDPLGYEYWRRGLATLFPDFTELVAHLQGKIFDSAERPLGSTTEDNFEGRLLEVLMGDAVIPHGNRSVSFFWCVFDEVRARYDARGQHYDAEALKRRITHVVTSVVLQGPANSSHEEPEPLFDYVVRESMRPGTLDFVAPIRAPSGYRPISMDMLSNVPDPEGASPEQIVVDDSLQLVAPAKSKYVLISQWADAFASVKVWEVSFIHMAEKYVQKLRRLPEPERAEALAAAGLSTHDYKRLKVCVPVLKKIVSRDRFMRTFSELSEATLLDATPEERHAFYLWSHVDKGAVAKQLRIKNITQAMEKLCTAVGCLLRCSKDCRRLARLIFAARQQLHDMFDAQVRAQSQLPGRATPEQLDKIRNRLEEMNHMFSIVRHEDALKFMSSNALDDGSPNQQ